MMIKQDLYARQKQAPKITNFKETLPAFQSDMAQELFKDPCSFEFLTLQKPRNEREIENVLVDNIRDFLLQLGQGFSFVGNQYHIDVGGDDFYIDMWLFNIELSCYVFIELKTGKYRAEYSGQLNFYLTAVDEILKKNEHNATNCFQSS